MKFLLIFLLCSNAFSEEKNFSFKREESTIQMLGNDLASPITQEYTKPLLIASGSIALFSVVFKKPIQHFENYAKNTKPLGSTSKYGDKLGQLAPNIAYVFYNLGDGYFNSNKSSQYLAGVMARATLSSSLTTTILKYSVREKRPDPSTSKTSFPSGHATTAFTFASVVAYQHGPWWGGASYLMATFVGFSRLNDNAHHLQDVMAGALIGTIYGQAISKRDEKFLHSSNEEITLVVSPLLSHDIAGINLEITF